MYENIVAGVLIGLIILSVATANYVIDKSVLSVPLGTYVINNITFIFADKTPSNCANSSASGCAYISDKTVYLINHDYISYDSMKHLCNHELCHIYLSSSESVCTYFPGTFWECDDLLEQVKLRNEFPGNSGNIISLKGYHENGWTKAVYNGTHLQNHYIKCMNSKVMNITPVAEAIIYVGSGWEYPDYIPQEWIDKWC